MYRLLLLLTLSVLVEPHCHRRHKPWERRIHHDYHRRHENRFLEEVAREVIGVDRKIQNYCNNKQNQDTLEIYGMEQYKLVVRLPGFTEDDITVKVKYRVISISANREDKSYTDVRIIPDIANGYNATWGYADGELSINFPYNILPKNNVDKTCGRDINDTVVILPKSKETDNFSIDIRFGQIDLEGGQKGIKSLDGNDNLVVGTEPNIASSTIKDVSDNVV